MQAASGPYLYSQRLDYFSLVSSICSFLGFFCVIFFGSSSLYAVLCHHFSMAPTKCIGCDAVRRGTTPFYLLDSIENALQSVNDLRQGSNKRLKLLPPIDLCISGSKLCKSCYDYIRYQPVTLPVYDGTPDLKIFRQAPHSNHQCSFGCMRPTELTRMSSKLRYDLLMNFKFYTEDEARMCASHIGTNNWWPFVKQIRSSVASSEFEKVANLMFNLHQKLDHSGNPTLLIKS